MRRESRLDDSVIRLRENMTEYEFHRARDFRPGHYRPLPSSWLQLDPDAHFPG